MLALTLLDNCVKNCGHPFHLQIATKEFLNTLVRKFPERPLTVPTPVQNRVLELIQEWYTTLCKSSRYKEDLVHIRDMHRLLSFKGYRFPQTKNSSAAVLNPVDAIKTPAELEEEDRQAQSAKLQELVRRGRPEDVRAANELVKKMTGFEQDDKPDYVEQAQAELNKVLQKAALLNEMLNDVKAGEIIGKGDIFADLFGTCKAVQPRVQKIISEKKDPDNIDLLLRLDEVLTIVIEQYGQVKDGNLLKVTLPENNGEVGGNKTPSNGRNGDIGDTPTTPKQKQSSLIDLMGFDSSSSSPSSNPTTPVTTGNLMDDLMNLNFNDAPPPSWGAVGMINLGLANNNISNSPTSPTTPNVTGGSFTSSLLGPPISGIDTHSTGLFASTSTPNLMPSAISRTASPLDDFDFVSNTGVSSQENSNSTVVLLNKNGFQIELDIEKQTPVQSSSELFYKIRAYFSNNQNSPISALTFRVAVPKTLQLKLDPQSAQVIEPFSKKSVTQDISIRATAITSSVIRMKYHVSYILGGRTFEEQGEFNQFP
ncbi:hypothetical protein BGZ76_010391 [Entomortierella beljakovae]|nr:hypothetical protein BGZ76_010391 [Entomortierella beljakovae]